MLVAFKVDTPLFIKSITTMKVIWNFISFLNLQSLDILKSDGSFVQLPMLSREAKASCTLNKTYRFHAFAR
ncbi:CLUMA_CG003546, isoform A [Clunio marinus]|uniref:CLUMA_CG003546, isoform A n=1 Tax=Clunio marinus TaxID=568069 RepID=A0A1J1HP48_9DIPT|nr:CLUMA_CG003546, isoform A [Clunio marinus]